MSTDVALFNQTETTPPDTGELGMTRQQAEAYQTIQAQVILARRFPRNEDSAYQKILKACERFEFADMVTYSFPRGKDEQGRTNLVSGPSVYLARQAKRAWGNVLSGVRVVHEDDEKMIGEAAAWDLETNTREYKEFTVLKMIWRKGRRGEQGRYEIGSDRELREKFNGIAARFERQCILELMPPDFIDDAVHKAAAVVQKGIREDPGKAETQMLVGFQQLGVTADMLAELLGHPVGQCSPEEVNQLREVWKTIRDGHATWSDYVSSDDKPEKTEASISLDKVRAAAEKNRGHDEAAPKKRRGRPPKKKPSEPEQADAPPGLRLSEFSEDDRNLVEPWLSAEHGCDSFHECASFVATWEDTKQALLMAALRWKNQQQPKPSAPEHVIKGEEQLF